jgi:hypothetical protein
MMMPLPLRILMAISMGGGLLLAIASTLGSLAWRQPKVSVKELFWAGSDLAAHPERYVLPKAVTPVRRLFLLSVCMWLSGIVALVGYSVLVVVQH